MIKIPAKLNQKLLQDELGSIEGGVKHMKFCFNQIYTQNDLYFFNEYTDHGYRHINSVLEQISKLIPQETWKSLSANDAALIIMSTFLHDLGMHIQPLTFKAMIFGEYDDVISGDFHDKKWIDLWVEYCEEAKKFSEIELKKLFGNSAYEIEIPEFIENENLNDNQKKFIGEFIRRHHPRMAYELAMKGLKSSAGDFIDLCKFIDDDFRFLGGLIARSHGMNVRDTFDILKSKYVGGIWSSPFDIRIVYLMILLRLADYLQVDNSRVLKIPYQTKAFKSPLSITEHKKHLCVAAPQELPHDNETVFFNVSPPNSLIFVSLESLFRSIQNELDLSWAIISEVYSEKLKLGLKYRRVKSSLEVTSMNDKLSYVSELITFSADKELLKLLIAPLYGYDPSFGIRELLQNSVDACWEREWIEKKNGNDYQGKIILRFNHIQNHEKVEFSIFDNGKGMTLTEIKNYFLRAGSSLKKSEEWRKDFINDSKAPIIHRIGKFGIGVLAAFLLGDEIFVETRHIKSIVGYSFKTRIDSENIEIQKLNNLDVGTKITIFISYDIRNKLFKGIKDRLKENYPDQYFKSTSNWDKWFCLDNPEVIIEVDNHPEFHPYSRPNPKTITTDNEDWNLILNTEFADVLWTYSDTYTRVFFSVNGIVIPQPYEFSFRIPLTLPIKKPYISCFDYKGRLPLKLNRSSLATKILPFENELLKSIILVIIKKILLHEVSLNEGILTVSKDVSFLPFLGLSKFPLFLYTIDGYTIDLPVLLKENAEFLFLECFNIGDEYEDELEDEFEDESASIKGYKAKIISPELLRKKTEVSFFLKLSPIFTGIAFNRNYFGGLYLNKQILDSPQHKILGKKCLKQNIFEINKFERGFKIEPKFAKYYSKLSFSEFEIGFKETFKEIIGEDMLIPYDTKKRMELVSKIKNIE